MQKPDFTDEELMAYADGELPETRAAELDQALAEDGTLSDRLAVFIDTRTLAKEAWDDVLTEPVPAHLVQHVRDMAATTEAEEDDTVVAFPARAAEPAPTAVWKLPLAACLALAVGLGAGLMISRQGDSVPGGLEIATLRDSAMIEALNNLPSGDEQMLADGARLAPIATFFDGAQTLCREFELDRPDGITVVSVACRSGADWDVRMAIAAAGAGEDSYAPASSLEALDAYLSASDAGPPLDPDAEAAALERLR